MIPRLHENKFIDTWIKGTLVFVVSHLLILAGMALAEGSFVPLNVFFILDLHLFFPVLADSVWAHVLSGVIVVCVFGFFYMQRKK